jgi:hypothetical protein
MAGCCGPNFRKAVCGVSQKQIALRRHWPYRNKHRGISMKKPAEYARQSRWFDRKGPGRLNWAATMAAKQRHVAVAQIEYLPLITLRCVAEDGSRQAKLMGGW